MWRKAIVQLQRVNKKDHQRELSPTHRDDLLDSFELEMRQAQEKKTQLARTKRYAEKIAESWTKRGGFSFLLENIIKNLSMEPADIRQLKLRRTLFTASQRLLEQLMRQSHGDRAMLKRKIRASRASMSPHLRGSDDPDPFNIFGDISLYANQQKDTHLMYYNANEVEFGRRRGSDTNLLAHPPTIFVKSMNIVRPIRKSTLQVTTSQEVRRTSTVDMSSNNNTIRPRSRGAPLESPRKISTHPESLKFLKPPDLRIEMLGLPLESRIKTQPSSDRNHLEISIASGMTDRKHHEQDKRPNQRSKERLPMRNMYFVYFPQIRPVPVKNQDLSQSLGQSGLQSPRSMRKLKLPSPKAANVKIQLNGDIASGRKDDLIIESPILRRNMKDMSNNSILSPRNSQQHAGKALLPYLPTGRKVVRLPKDHKQVL